MAFKGLRDPRSHSRRMRCPGFDLLRQSSRSRANCAGTLSTIFETAAQGWFGTADFQAMDCSLPRH